MCPVPAAPLTSEISLLAGVLAGERSSRGEFVRRYDRLVRSCVVKVLRRCGVACSRDEVADLTSEAWLTLWRDDLRKLRQYQADRGYRLASWVALIATNSTIDQLRARAAPTTPLDEVLESPAVVIYEAAEHKLLQRERADLARAALARLSAEERSFVQACFHDERSPEEMARQAGLSVNTIYSRKFKLREKLVRLVQEIERGEGRGALAWAA